jgi:hypothetical protein
MDEERIQGEFNSAFEYLRRISVAFEICNEGSTNMNAGLWCQGLVVAFKELSTKMKGQELNDKMPELKSLVELTTNSRKGRVCIDASVYWRLFLFELFLRRVFAEAGLEMKHRPDANRILFQGGI